MFSSTPNYTKLKTNLRLALNRLKLLEKKKAELAQKARKEIADYLATGKTERARIRVEHIIREDYLVEAMEIIEVYCDLLLARFGLVTQMKELDAGISEAVSSIVWVCPRMQSDIAELKVISDIFIQKYGPQFAEQARSSTGNHNVSEKLMHKLQLQAPPKLLVEKYLIEIARNYQIDYEPDPQVMKEDQKSENHLIDLSERNNLDGTAPPQMGFIGYPSVPPLPESSTNKPFNYPPPYGGSGPGFNTSRNSQSNASGNNPSAPFTFNIPPNDQHNADQSKEKKDLNINSNFIHGESSRANNNGSPDENFLNAPANIQNRNQRISPPPRYSSINPHNSQKSDKPKPQPRGKMTLPPPSGNEYPGIPDLPNVPSDLPDIPGDEPPKNNIDDDIDFDDLSRRFEELKKKK